MEPNTHKDPDQKNVMRLYGALGAGIVLCVLPYSAAAFLSFVFITGVLIAAYIMRGGKAIDSLMENHATYIIRSIWIAGFGTILTLIAASIYMLAYIDNEPLGFCVDQFMALDPVQASNPQALLNVIQPCIDGFISSNAHVLFMSTLISAGPIVLYMIVRFGRGLSRASSGYRVAKPKGWF